MKPIQLAFLRTIAVGAASFGLIGSAIALAFPTQRVILAVDRSFCPSDRWQATSQIYRDRYQAHQTRSIQIARVVLVGDLGQDVLATPPKPEDFAKLTTFGQPNPAALDHWQNGQANPPDLKGVAVEVLRCGG